MKITQAPPVQTTEKSPKVKSATEGDPNAFQKVLSEACQSNGAADSAAPQCQAADPLAGLEGAARLARSQVVDSSAGEEGITHIQAALDLLESYQQQLADPRISLKEMMPVVRALEAEIHDLRRLEGQAVLPVDLSRIASEVAVTAQVEVSKFHRGDYI